MAETATEWLVFVRVRYGRLFYITADIPITAEQAWLKARQDLTIADADEISEVLATPVRAMQKVEHF